MSAAYWVYAALVVVGALANVCTVGKPRKPLDGPAAAIALVIQAGLIFLLVKAALA